MPQNLSLQVSRRKEKQHTKSAPCKLVQEILEAASDDDDEVSVGPLRYSKRTPHATNSLSELGTGFKGTISTSFAQSVASALDGSSLPLTRSGWRRRSKMA